MKFKISNPERYELVGAYIFCVNGRKIMLIDPNTPYELRKNFEKDAKRNGARIADPDEFPIYRGTMFEDKYSEHYPSVRWNFNWENYVVVGIPNGITDDFVYEFKTTRKRFFMNAYLKNLAFTQADLYGYFLKRYVKRVQIRINEEGKTDRKPLIPRNA